MRVVNFKDYFTKLDTENQQAADAAAKRAKFKTESKEGFFTPTLDKEGNATIIIRFLPPKEGEIFPYAKKVQHAFEGPNGWMICNCLKEFNHVCPICKANNALYASKNQDNINIAKLHKRKPIYAANILIVKNENAPETVGKVFKLHYKAMFDTFIKNATKDSTDPETGEIIKGFNAFDYETGANFIWIIKKGKYGPDYMDSKFSVSKRINLNNKPLSDDEITLIDKQLYPLIEYNGQAPENLDDEYTRIINLYEKKMGEALNIPIDSNLPKQEMVSSHQTSASNNQGNNLAKSNSDTKVKSIQQTTVKVENDDDSFWKSIEEG